MSQALAWHSENPPTINAGFRNRVFTFELKMKANYWGIAYISYGRNLSRNRELEVREGMNGGTEGEILPERGREGIMERRNAGNMYRCRI